MSTELLRVLHVDDDPSQLQMMKLVFDHMAKSVDVVSCGSPFEAVKLVAEDGFDCVVSDYVMPGLNGIDLAEKIMLIKNIPFILYTGQGSEEVAQRAFKMGIHDYIRKEIEPSHYQVLLNSIRQSVKKHRAEQIYRVVFESNPDPILVVHENKIKYSNRASAALFGVQDEACLHGKNFMDYLLDSNHDELAWVSLQRIVSENSVIPFEFDIKGEDGFVRRVMGGLQNMVFLGTPSQVYFLRDVTSVRRIESSLLHATHRFNKLFELSPIGLALSTIDGKVSRCNRSFKEILGLDEDCTGFNLLSEQQLYKKIRGKLFLSDSICHEAEYSFTDLRNAGLVDSNKDGFIKLKLIVSPVLQDDSDPIYLLQIQDLSMPRLTM